MRNLNHEIKLFDRLISVEYTNILSLIIRQSGKVVFENHYRGTHQDERRPVMSVTKSILSAVMGIAVDKHLIGSENIRIIDVFKEYLSSECDPNILRVRLKHLLTMTSGLYYQRLAGDSQPVVARRNTYNDWVKFMLELPIQTPDLQTFCYSNFNADLIAAVIRRCTKENIVNFSNKYLFLPLGFEPIEWPTIDTKDNIVGDICLSTHEMSIFGELYLNEGSYQGNQIISKEWVKKSVYDYGNRYGYLWWLGKDRMFFASGAGGALICVSPDHELVIAMQSKNLKTNWKSPIHLIEEIFIK